MNGKATMRWVALSFTVLVSQIACAENASKAGGRWSGSLGNRIIEMNAITLNAEERYLAAEIVIAQPGCSGGIAGIGQVQGDLLTLSPYMPDKDFKACKVIIQFDQKGTTANLSEIGCSDYHGASCSFSGKLKKIKAKE